MKDGLNKEVRRKAMDDVLNNEERLKVIKKRLKLMSQLGHQIRASGWDEKASAKDDRYIRIKGESLRAVSLNDLSPLCGFGKSGNARAVATVIRHFEDEGRIPVKLAEADHGRKKERRLQSYIIKQALLSQRNLLGNTSLGCIGKEFDKLVFALDEVSFGDNNNSPVIRCDLLAVGQRGGEIFPAVIELKSNRELDRLDEQLENATRHIEKTYENVKELLEVVTGLKLNSQRVEKILVWPSPNGKESRETTRFRQDNPDIKFIEYSPVSYRTLSEVKFEARDK